MAPRKVKRREAEAAFIQARQRLSKGGQTAEEARAFLIDRMAAYAASPQGQGKFCTYPSTWLRAGQYDDDPAEWQKGGKQGDGAQTFRNQADEQVVSHQA